MKKSYLALGTIISALLFSSCSKSLEEEFTDANSFFAKKYIKKIQIINNLDRSDTKVYIIDYDSKNRVSGISDGDLNELLFSRNSSETKEASSEAKIFNINSLYISPYDVYQYGNVISYDERANPVEIEVLENGIDSDLLVGTIKYDNMPNPHFYTLEAAGIIDVRDRLEFNFGFSQPQLVSARQLLPNNNIKEMIFTDLSGLIKYQVEVDYVYDDDGYVTHAYSNAVSGDESLSSTILYSYK